VVLKDGEYVVEDCEASIESFLDELDLSAIFAPHGFVLTNQRLIVLKKKVTENKITSFELEKEFPLESIKDIATEESRTIIYTDEGKHMFNTGIHFCRGMPPRMHPAYASKYFRNKVIQQKEKKMFVIDFSSLRSLMEKGGIVLTTLKCPHCSAPIKMPKDGTETVCNHCGNTIYAHDIFEKIKALIS